MSVLQNETEALFYLDSGPYETGIFAPLLQGQSKILFFHPRFKSNRHWNLHLAELNLGSGFLSDRKQLAVGSTTWTCRR